MLAKAIQNLAPDWKYRGSCTADNKEAFEKLVSLEGDKPEWVDVEAEMVRLNTEADKEEAIHAAKQKLKDTMSSGCEWNGYTWGCDETDRKRFQEGLVLLDLMQFENCNVWTMDGTKVTVTAAEYRQLCTTIAMTFAGAFEAYKDETSI